tara:strand:- start:939 stop:1268 length:330 start_codon:yes stop_codon:yes gene_type:complete
MKGMSKGIGPKRLGSPNKMGHMSKSAAKINREADIMAKRKRISKDKAVRLADRADKLLDKGFAKKDESGKLTKRGARQMKKGLVLSAKSLGLKGKDARKDAENMMRKFK